jgi:hypothetical protein
MIFMSPFPDISGDTQHEKPAVLPGGQWRLPRLSRRPHLPGNQADGDNQADEEAVGFFSLGFGYTYIYIDIHMGMNIYIWDVYIYPYGFFSLGFRKI